MPLMIHDTAARARRAFVPREGVDEVTLYVCGPTVYGRAHIGNARPAVVFDVLARVLRRLYPARRIVYARNVTDVDDKINAKAAAEGVAIGVVAARFTDAYREDMAALGVEPPTREPRATDHIAAMIDQIARLIAAGHAYLAEGHVLFSTSSFPGYGELSGRTPGELLAGARVDVAPYKREAADFVLWKPATPDAPAWESPWGPGRPGWHIECSAMIETVLGLPVDIHGGGHDLIFPHHENERAQGVCVQRGGDYARYWMHNGFLTLDAQKMSKSAGEIVTVHDLLAHTPGEALRWALLSAHYRAPLEWSEDLVAQSRKALDRLYGALQDAERFLAESPPAAAGRGGERARLAAIESQAGVWGRLLDDLATPAAFADLFALGDHVRSALAARDRVAVFACVEALRTAAGWMGFLGQDPDAWFEGGVDASAKTRIEALVTARGAARRERDWAAADRLRAELADLGVEVLDGAAGAASWRFRD